MKLCADTQRQIVGSGGGQNGCKFTRTNEIYKTLALSSKVLRTIELLRFFFMHLLQVDWTTLYVQQSSSCRDKTTNCMGQVQFRQTFCDNIITCSFLCSQSLSKGSFPSSPHFCLSLTFSILRASRTCFVRVRISRFYNKKRKRKMSENKCRCHLNGPHW